MKTKDKNLRKWIKSFDSIDETEWLEKKSGYKVVINQDEKEVLMNSQTNQEYVFDEKKYEKL